MKQRAEVEQAGDDQALQRRVDYWVGQYRGSGDVWIGWRDAIGEEEKQYDGRQHRNGEAAVRITPGDAPLHIWFGVRDEEGQIQGARAAFWALEQPFTTSNFNIPIEIGQVGDEGLSGRYVNRIGRGRSEVVYDLQRRGEQLAGKISVYEARPNGPADKLDKRYEFVFRDLIKEK